MSRLKIVGFVCDTVERYLESSKVIKILKQAACRDVTLARTFIDICVYYHIWIKDFIAITEPIFRLFRSDTPFIWDNEQFALIDKLKLALTSMSALLLLNYDKNAGNIILGVDASLIEWKAILQQLVLHRDK